MLLKYTGQLLPGKAKIHLHLSYTPRAHCTSLSSQLQNDGRLCLYSVEFGI